MDTGFRFACQGHPNIKAAHSATIEVTKDPNLSPRGDCIIGVRADFDTKRLQRFLEGAARLEIVITCDEFTEIIKADHNPSFIADKEIVIRRGPFTSERTLATGADRACVDLSRDFVEMIKDPNAVILVGIRKV